MIKRFFYWYNENEIQIKLWLIVVIFIIVALFLTSCRTSRVVTRIDYKIDTVFINHNIHTVSTERDTLLKHDTLRVENEFSKVKVYYNLNKIHVDLTSKPFEIPVKLSVSKKEVIRTAPKIKFITIFSYCILSYLLGAICLFIVLEKFKAISYGRN